METVKAIQTNAFMIVKITNQFAISSSITAGITGREWHKSLRHSNTFRLLLMSKIMWILEQSWTNN